MSSKKNYYQKYFTEHSNNVKKLWIGIKEIINVKYKSYDTPNCLDVDKESITDNTEICNKFNDHLPSIADNIPKDNKKPILKHLIIILVTLLIIPLSLNHVLQGK